MKLVVYLDSCAWNYIYRRGIDIETDLPGELYERRVTAEVAIELAAIPDVGEDGTCKIALKAWIQNSMELGSIPTTRAFGFAGRKVDGSLHNVPYGSFGNGTFQSSDERAVYADYYRVDRPLKLKSNGLPPKLTDAVLAWRATNAVVLTAESAKTKGPFKSAAKAGKRVIFLGDDFESSGMSLGEYIKHSLGKVK